MKYLVFLLTLISWTAMAQDITPQAYRQDFALTVDNDAFLAQAVDRYYSSGIFFRYRRLLNPESTLARAGGNAVDKAIYSVGLTHLFFTPSDIKLRTIDQFDRPYAGLIALSFGVQYIRNQRTSLQLKLEGGILGPSAGVAQLQEWYHNVIGAKTPRGWQFQIENTPLLSVEMNYRRSLWRGTKMELTGEGHLQAGTVFNAVKPGLGFRWGKLGSPENSSFYQSRLGTISRDQPKADWKESFFFLTASLGIVGYDASIQGNWIGQESLHTEAPQRVRYHITYGWIHALKRWDLGLAFNNVRRETTESRDHYYVTIDLHFRL